MRNLVLWTPGDRYTVDEEARKAPGFTFSARRWIAWWAWAFLHFMIGYLVATAVCNASR